MTFLMIVMGSAALALGIYFGLPGDSRDAEQEIEEAILEGRSSESSKRAKRVFTPVEWLMRRQKESEIRQRRTQTRKPFDLYVAKKKAEPPE